jgi:multidrug resistance protein MdtO
VSTALAAQEVRPRSRPWFAVLACELAPTPDRLDATLRIVATCALVVVISMSLEIPEMALSAYIVFFIYREDPVTTALTGVMGIIGISMAIGLTILAFMFTLEYPALRLSAMAGIFFLGMFVWRTAANTPAGFVLGWILGFFVMVTQSAVDHTSQPEAIVRAALWFWVAITFPVALLIAMNLVFPPRDPEKMLLGELGDRLRAIADGLTGLTDGDSETAVARLMALAETGSQRLFNLQRLAEIRDAGLKPVHASREALITLVDRLIAATAALDMYGQVPAASDRAHVRSLAAECERLSSAIESPGVCSDIRARDEVPSAPESVSPRVREIEQLVEAIYLALRPDAAARTSAPSQPGHRAPFFRVDAFTNPMYPRFALKATLAVMFCYVAYTALDWPGIHTCVITCAVVALTSTGATIHKATLRIVGCTVGSALAVVATVFFVPHLESITGLVLLVAAVSAPAAWIATGSERYTYAGLQMAFAFFLCVLQGYTPGTEITMVRDRFIGILFGNITMALVFAYVWPERAALDLGKPFRDALRNLARLTRTLSHREMTEAQGQVQDLRRGISEELGATRKLAEIAVFEPQSLTVEGKAQLMSVRRSLSSAQAAFLVATALSERVADRAALERHAETVTLNDAIAAALESSADATPGNSAAVRSSITAAFDALERQLDGAHPLRPLYVAYISAVDILLDETLRPAQYQSSPDDQRGTEKPA